MGGGARALVRQPKTAVFFLQKSPKPGGSKSVNEVERKILIRTNMLLQRALE